MSTYSVTPRGDVVLIMSEAEARGLYARAENGAGATFEDEGHAKAAQRAVTALAKCCGKMTRDTEAYERFMAARGAAKKVAT